MMSGSSKQVLQTESTDETSETKEVALRDGKTLVVSDAGVDQLVEIRSASGMVEVRIRLTEQGPVLQMEAVRLQLKATESVEIESERVAIKGTQQVTVEGGQVEVDAKETAETGASGRVIVRGTRIDLN